MRILRIIVRIVKDAISMLLQCIATTIMFCVCAKEGWIIPSYNITNDVFWVIYQHFLAVALIVMFIRGFNGKYLDNEIGVTIKTLYPSGKGIYVETGGKENA